MINYKEIYLDVKFDNLVRRDNKGIYKKALEGSLNNVIGVDGPNIILRLFSDNKKISQKRRFLVFQKF